MNRRVMLAGGLLAGLAVLALYAALRVRGICAELLRLQTAAVQAAEANAPETGAAIAALTEYWDANVCLLQTVVAGSVTGDLDTSVQRLLPLYEAGCDELTAELAAAGSDIRWIREQEIMVF